MPPIPANFPRIAMPAEKVDALAWYDTAKAGHALSKMQFQARDEIVPLTFPHPKYENWLGVPRTLAPEPGSTTDFRSIGNHEFEAKFTSELRSEQVPFVDGVFSALENELGCIGEAPTGFGKTTTGCKLITHIGRSTCIVIPKGDLDWGDELLKHTDIPKERISYWQGGKLPDPEAWVVIAMLQSVYRLHHYSPEIYNRFGCLIVDEVHRIASEEFSALMRQFPAMWRLGLSATPERRDGKMDLIHSHMGWRHVVGYSDAEQPDYYVINSTWTEPFGKNGKVVRYDPSRTNHAKRSMMLDPVRNAQIAGAVYRAHKAGRRTVIFIEQIKHGERIRKALQSMRVPDNMIIDYNGGISAADKAYAKTCPAGIVLIATYKYAAEGTNIPPLDTAVIAHPIYDPTQPVGRILRKLDGKPKPIVLDVWDSSCGSLKSIATKRWETLRKQGAEWKGLFG